MMDFFLWYLLGAFVTTFVLLQSNRLRGIIPAEYDGKDWLAMFGLGFVFWPIGVVLILTVEVVDNTDKVFEALVKER